MQANKYFKVKELVSSKIYKEYGDDAIKFLDPKALKALENVREILGVPLICNNWAAGGSRNYCGYREPGCGVGVKNSYHCIDINTEILTNHGWKTYNTIDIQNDKVYSYNIDKNGIEIVPIQQYFFQKYDGEIIQIQNKLIDIFVTDQHRLLTKAKNNYKDREFYRFELAKDSFGKRREIMNAANNLSVSEDFDLNIWRLAMAVIANGSISKKILENIIILYLSWLKKEILMNWKTFYIILIYLIVKLKLLVIIYQMAILIIVGNIYFQ